MEVAIVVVATTAAWTVLTIGEIMVEEKEHKTIFKGWFPSHEIYVQFPTQDRPNLMAIPGPFFLEIVEVEEKDD